MKKEILVSVLLSFFCSAYFSLYDGEPKRQWLDDSCTRKWAGGDMFLLCFDGKNLHYSFAALSDYKFPAEQRGDTILVYWDIAPAQAADTTLEKNFNISGGPKKGELFMELHPGMDAVLNARYLQPAWIKKFNLASSSTKKDGLGLFPEKFVLVDF